MKSNFFLVTDVKNNSSWTVYGMSSVIALLRENGCLINNSKNDLHRVYDNLAVVIKNRSGNAFIVETVYDGENK